MLSDILRAKFRLALLIVALPITVCYGQDCTIPAAPTCFKAIRVVNDYTQTSSGTFSLDAPDIPGGRFFVLPNGTVAVGAPNGASVQGYKLQVWGPTWLGSLVIGDGNKGINNIINFFPGTLGNKINLYGSANGDSYGLGISGSQLNYRVSGAASSHVFYAGGNNNNGTELMRIKGNGYVGIGIDPTEKLHVSGNIAMEKDGIKMWMTDSPDKQWGWMGTSSNHGLILGTNNIAGISLTAKGAVGIGRIDPGAKLHVAGDAIFDDVVSFKKDVSFGGNFNFPGTLKLLQSGYIQLGSDVSPREASAGQIGYKKFTAGLDIVGAGVDVASREIAFHAQGGSFFYSGLDPDKKNILLSVWSTSDDKSGWIGTESRHGLSIGAVKKEALHIDTSGNMFAGFYDGNGIPKISPQTSAKYDLFVHKGILSEDYALAPVSAWADYVFDGNYHLRPLSEVDLFIKSSKHLPGILSQEQVRKDGYSIKDMNVKFLEKIEELTLYAIEQDKKLTEQNQKIKSLASQLEEYKQLAGEVAKLREMINNK